MVLHQRVKLFHHLPVGPQQNWKYLNCSTCLLIGQWVMLRLQYFQTISASGALTQQAGKTVNLWSSSANNSQFQSSSALNQVLEPYWTCIKLEAEVSSLWSWWQVRVCSDDLGELEVRLVSIRVRRGWHGATSWFRYQSRMRIHTTGDSWGPAPATDTMSHICSSYDFCCRNK